MDWLLYSIAVVVAVAVAVMISRIGRRIELIDGLSKRGKLYIYRLDHVTGFDFQQ